MIPQAQGRIFLAEERGLHEMDWFRSYHTFNFGSYQTAHKTPVGSLYLLNDDTLASGKTLTLQVEQPSVILLLPIVGGIQWKDNRHNSGWVEAGECTRLCLPAGATVELLNPYKDELVNFLQCWFTTPEAPVAHTSYLYAFDLDATKNQLAELFPMPDGATASLHHYIAKLDGRAEITYRLKRAGNKVFVMVITGAFEVQYRLLHPRDGLALWDVDEIELEALSNEAIIVITEIQEEA